ncbi:MAG: helix-turn-helix domain-containing protein [Treponema sp.]|nr:helix-turn-helix domain-containing protein [Treponema sp.]
MGFRENLKQEMAYLDMPVKQLAALSGVKPQTIASYLGTRAKIPSANAAVQIAQVLGVSVEYLVTGKEPTARRRPIPFSPDTRHVIKTMADLDTADQKIVVQVAALLKDRENKPGHC